MIENWHPMDTASKDGRRIWIATPAGEVILSHWNARWINLGTKEVPMAWHEYFKPRHPNALT